MTILHILYRVRLFWEHNYHSNVNAMNNKLKYIIIGAAALTVTGCFADLDLMPIDADTPSTFFKDSTSCAKALVGCYDALNRPGECLFDGAENSLFSIWNMTDEMYNAAYGTGPKVYSYTSGYSPLASLYRKYYVAIERCNQLLHYLPEATMSESAKRQIDGEARFLRAFLYFNLAQNWGRVPLITDAVSNVNNPNAEQAEEGDIYDWCISEMIIAEDEVKPIEEWGFGGRVNKSAVRAAIARVCLFKAGWPCYDESKYEEAYLWAKKVIDDPVHSLIPNYAEAFIPLIQDKYDIRENLWEIESYFAAKTDGLKEYTPSLSVTLGTKCSKQDNVAFSVNSTKNVTKTMFEYYEQDPECRLGSFDERRNWSIAPYTLAVPNEVVDGRAKKTTIRYTYYDYKGLENTNDGLLYKRQVNKFNRQYALIHPAYDSNTGTNLCIFRYADVLLMAAEALCQIHGEPTDEAVGYVNEIRKRAYGQLDGRQFIDRIELVSAGTGYKKGEVCVDITDPEDGVVVTSLTTAEKTAPQIYMRGYAKGAPTVAVAEVNDDGSIASIQLLDRGHAYKSTPTVTVRSMTGKAQGTGAEVAVVMRTEAPAYELSEEATADKDAFMKTIMEERARELCFEGWRRLDLKRWHNLVETLQYTRDVAKNSSGLSAAEVEYASIPGNNVNDAFYYLPIPASEMMLNQSLTQNPGW